jgi:ATP-dependent Clp protease protease subunit
VKFWNLNVKRGADGSKHLDVQLHGVIDGSWWDENPISTSEIISELQQHLDAKTIGVRINSVGGSAFGGIAMYNALQSHPGEVTCYVEGLAASAASLVAMAGKTCMGVGAMMMIHPPSTVAMGNAEDLRKTADILDKVQDGLSAIYMAKTGKGLDEVNALVDAETWMTGDEAVAAGFADAIGSADGNDDEPSEDDGGGDDDQPQMANDAVMWRGAQFPVAFVPGQILAMAKSPPPPVAPSAPAPVLALVPTPEPPAPLTRAELTLRAPELVAELIEEGRKAGVTAERARLQAIDDLGVKGAPDLVAAAKYGEKPSDAASLALAIVKAGQFAGQELLALRRAESRGIAAITPGAPDQSTDQEAQAIALMVAAAQAHNGGKGK